MLKTDEMRERLERGGFTDQQAGALIVVIEELAEVFVTKGYFDATLRAELAELESSFERKMRVWAIAILGLNLAGTALLLALFSFAS